ncbi:MAG TPA: hypothetical protein VHQ01_02230 [Pyrinomonadaceae bacterium]|nr:hypothetical protein [Pyrinomonadaceae bacterium]
MIKRNTAKATQTRAKQQKAAPRRWPTFMLILVCGLMLVSGFFFAGRQHFSSMDYGMKNSRLRKQIDDLEAEKRRLLLAREVAMSPTEIKKAAKKIGITDAPAPEVELAKTIAPVKDKIIPVATTATAAPPVNPMIVKTASVTPASAPIAATYSKPDKNVKPISVKRMTTIAAE